MRPRPSMPRRVPALLVLGLAAAALTAGTVHAAAATGPQTPAPAPACGVLESYPQQPAPCPREPAPDAGTPVGHDVRTGITSVGADGATPGDHGVHSAPGAPGTGDAPGAVATTGTADPDYWTPERMAAARPLPMPRPDAPSPVQPPN